MKLPLLQRQKSGAESGQVLVFFALLLGVLLIIAALAIDIPRVYRERQRAQSVADAAALAGAMEVDPFLLWSINEFALTNGARRKALEYCRRSGEVCEVLVFYRLVQVRVQREVPLVFGRAVGVPRVTVVATGRARLAPGY